MANLKKILDWFIFSYIFSWNLVYLAVAFIAYYFFTPALSEMKNLSPGWISEILIRNYVIGTIFFSLIHIPLYVKKSQGIKFKFNPNWPEKIQKIFTFNKQIFDNLFYLTFSRVEITSQANALFFPIIPSLSVVFAFILILFGLINLMNLSTTSVTALK